MTLKDINISEFGYKPLSDFADITSPHLAELKCDLFTKIDILYYARGERSLLDLKDGTIIQMLKENIDIYGSFNVSNS